MQIQKKFLVFLLLIYFCGTVFSMTGEGTNQNPFVIFNCTDLQNIKNNLNSSYVLDHNIDCGWETEQGSLSNDGEGFEPIGWRDSWSENPFTGTLNGQGHSIEGLYINRGGDVGLFGVVSSATVINLDLMVKIPMGGTVGGVAGAARYSTFRNVNVSGVIGYNNHLYEDYSKMLETGGIVGNAYRSELFSVTNSASILGCVSQGGGLVGTLEESNIIFSKNFGIVDSKYRYIDDDDDYDTYCSNYVGGIAGYLKKSNVLSSRNEGSVFASSDVGGIVGHAMESNIINCVNNALVEGYEAIGGIIGYGVDEYNYIAYSSNYGSVKGQYGHIGGIAGSLKSSVIFECNNEGNVLSSDIYPNGVGLSMGNGAWGVGGVAGYLTKSMVKNTQNNGDVTFEGDSGFGGIVGEAEWSEVSNCNNTGDLIGFGRINNMIGGIVGYFSQGKITNCENFGKILFGKSNIGGIVGRPIGVIIDDVQNFASLRPMWKDYKVSLSVEEFPSSYVGGLIGDGAYIQMSNALNDGNIYGHERIAGLVSNLQQSIMTNITNSGHIFGTRFVTETFISIYNAYLSTNVKASYSNLEGATATGEWVCENPLLCGVNYSWCDNFNIFCSSNDEAVCANAGFTRKCSTNSSSLYWPCDYLPKVCYIPSESTASKLNHSECIGAEWGTTHTGELSYLPKDSLIERKFVETLDKNTSRKCENWCDSDEYLDYVGGILPVCKVRDVGKNYCVGTGFSNSDYYAGDVTGLTVDTQKVLVDSNTGAKCEYHCLEGFKRGTGIDINRCLPVLAYSCTGDNFQNSTICPDANENLTANVPKTLVNLCSSPAAKCTYFCPSPNYYKVGNSCVLDCRPSNSHCPLGCTYAGGDTDCPPACIGGDNLCPNQCNYLNDSDCNRCKSGDLLCPDPCTYAGGDFDCPPVVCEIEGASCLENEDCCSNFCEGGICAQHCGNGICEPDLGEDSSSCREDCCVPSLGTCISGSDCCSGVCNAGVCIPIGGGTDLNCGNRIAEPLLGENCSSCPADVKCDWNQSCINGICVSVNSISKFNLFIDNNKLFVSVKCLFDAVADFNVFLDNNRVMSFSDSCNKVERVVEFISVDLNSATYRASIKINPVCDVCSREDYLRVGQIREASIPDNSILGLILVLLSVISIITISSFRK